MNNPTTQALQSLLPTLNTSLPGPLINLSTSLLAQSRSKASALKPDEEIARAYVCAHIACERLKQPLNLPQIDPRPPCPPRVYAKLFGYLTQALLVRGWTDEASRTPSGKGKREIGSDGRMAERTVTPRKGFTRAETRAETRVLSCKRGGAVALEVEDEVSEDGVQRWVMRLIRRVCRALDAPAAVPHVFAGVCSVLRLSSQPQPRPLPSTPSRKGARRSTTAASLTEERARGEGRRIGKEEIPALVVTIAIYTLTRMRLAGKGDVELDGEMDSVLRRRAISVVGEMEMQQGRLLGSEDDLQRDVEGLGRRAVEEGWLGGEWFANIPEGGGVGGSSDWGGGEEEGEGEDARGEEEEDHADEPTGVEEAFTVAPKTPLKRKLVMDDDGRGRLQCGLGTMMQERVDWLSEERRAEFRVWKRGILRRIEEIERGGVGGAGGTGDMGVGLGDGGGGGIEIRGAG